MIIVVSRSRVKRMLSIFSCTLRNVVSILASFILEMHILVGIFSYRLFLLDREATTILVMGGMLASFILFLIYIYIFCIFLSIFCINFLILMKPQLQSLQYRHLILCSLWFIEIDLLAASFNLQNITTKLV